MRRIYIVLFVVFAASAQAQEFRIDLNVRGNTMILMEDVDNSGREFGNFPIGVSAEAMFFLKDFVGIGAFYSRSVASGKFEYYQDGTYNYGTGGYNSLNTDFDYAMYGLAVQITTSRKRGFRIYGVGRAGKLEFVEDVDGFAIGDSEFAYSGGFGIMVKLSRRVSYNIFEASYAFLPKEFSVTNDVEIGAISVQSGISIRLLQKK